MSRLAVTARFWHSRIGATAIEYALIAGVVALVAVPGLIWLRNWQAELGQKLNAQFDPAAEAALIDARRDFREPPKDARDHQGL